MVEYAHANELHHEISEGQGSNRDGSEVDIIIAQGAGKLPDMLQGADLARRSSSIPQFQSSHVESEGEVGKATTVVFIEPNNRQIRDHLKEMQGIWVIKGRIYLVIRNSL